MPVAFRFHARALAALGRDLVTNDVVAVMELVKNSYDALASSVEIRIWTGSGNGSSSRIQIEDDGHGMDYATIRDVWCVIATPFRNERPISQKGSLKRPVTGEKGLGRLATARLGNTLDVVTKTDVGRALHFTVNWDKLLEADDLQNAGLGVSEASAANFSRQHGTCVTVSELRSTWNDAKIEELRRHLARLLSPFTSAADFSLRVRVEDDRRTSDDQPITPPAFMSRPKYALEGRVDDQGNIAACYRYHPFRNGDGREREFRDDWASLHESGTAEHPLLEPARCECGPFQFEIRAWDLTQEDAREIAEHFHEVRSHIRGAIRSQQGISLYRDDVLVLPKSDGGRDWLDLDIRRVSRVGTRLGTSQIVGYVRITKQANPQILDTSDREDLVANSASAAFRERVTRIVQLLEIERDSDRLKASRRITDLFAPLDADALVQRLEALRDRGGDVAEAVEAAQTFGDKLQRSRATIEKRFGYYNRLAVIGTLTQMIIHEIRNHTTVIDRGLRKAKALAERVRDETVAQAVEMAAQSVKTLETLNTRFAPMARRHYSSGRRTSVVEESLNRCVAMREAEVLSGKIEVRKLRGRTSVQIDPAELDAIVLNLVANAVYWLRRHKHDHRRLEFRVTPEPTRGRVSVGVDDSGPGFDDADRDRVFWPGVTRKPDGFGMGLTVASEIVEAHGGTIRATVPGRLGGASFDFDLPAVRGGSDQERRRRS